MNALYRGKRIDNGDWVYGVPHTTVRQMLIVSSEIDDWGEDYIAPDYWEVDPSTVGQYTGLKDKNGVRIFQGDIVDYKHPFRNRTGQYTVVRDVYKFKCDGFYMPHYDIPNDAFSEGTGYFEVIGNIHDKEAS